MSEWKEWRGSLREELPRPVRETARVVVLYRNGERDRALPAKAFRWSHRDHPADIIAYRAADQ